MKKAMMLCLAVCIVGLQVFPSRADTLPQGLNYMNVQQRNVEGGNTYNRLYFSMYDQNQTPAGNVLASATLYDPNGDIVSIPFPTYDPVNLLMGGYDVNSGQWNFGSGFDYFDNGYTASFDGDLIPGDYRLQVTTINGSTDEQTFKVSAPVECPIISSSSFHVWIDQSDNLVWDWELPAIDPDLNTSISAYMTTDGDDENFFLISVPTDMNRITIPKTTFDLLKARGNNIIMGLNLRINDEFGNNYQRNISNPYFLPLTSSPIKTTAVLSANEPDYTVTTGSYTLLYGTFLPNQIILESGAMAELINFPGQNSIQIQSSSDLFTVSRSGTGVTFQGSDETILKIPSTTDVQTISFNGEERRVLQIHNNQIMLDDQIITTTPAPIENDATNNLIGSWLYDADGLENSAVLTFIDDINYMFAVDGEPDDGGGRGMERGTYIWDASSGAFSAVMLSNTAGDWGIFADAGNQTVFISDDTLFYNLTDDEVIQFKKIKYAEVSEDNNAECGAYIAPGVWKEFDCYNLGAIGKDLGHHPFTPSWSLIGGYWQWGRKGPDSGFWHTANTSYFAHGPTGPGSAEANSGGIRQMPLTAPGLIATRLPMIRVLPVTGCQPEASGMVFRTTTSTPSARKARECGHPATPTILIDNTELI
jgi:hypothetical protein